MAGGESGKKRGRESVAKGRSGRMKLLRSVVLVGMMGSGKTAVGKVLAQRLGAPFLDSDSAIEAAAKASIPEIFSRDGEPFFRDREAEVLVRLLSGPPAVLSTGGGAFLAERNRRAIAAKGVALWLEADVETLWERVRHKDTRPLLRTPDPKGTLAALYETRVPIYRLAELKVRTEPGFSVEETASRALAVLASRHDIVETS